MNAMLGKTEPDPFGQLLGTGFQRFKSHCGVNGLAKEIGQMRLEVLAVESTKPGTGQLRKFVELTKKNYKGVIFWEVWNEDLSKALVRYGFRPVEKTDEFETISGLGWGDWLECQFYSWSFVQNKPAPDGLLMRVARG